MHRTDMDVCGCGCGWFIYEKKLMIDSVSMIRSTYFAFLSTSTTPSSSSRVSACVASIFHKCLVVLCTSSIATFLCHFYATANNQFRIVWPMKTERRIQWCVQSHDQRWSDEGPEISTKIVQRIIDWQQWTQSAWRLSCSNGSSGDTFFFEKVWKRFAGKSHTIGSIWVWDCCLFYSHHQILLKNKECPLNSVV